MALPTRDQLEHPEIWRMVRASLAEHLSGPMCGLTNRLYPHIALGSDRPLSAPTFQLARKSEAA